MTEKDTGGEQHQVRENAPEQRLSEQQPISGGINKPELQPPQGKLVFSTDLSHLEPEARRAFLKRTRRLFGVGSETTFTCHVPRFAKEDQEDPTAASDSEPSQPNLRLPPSDTEHR